MRIYCFKYSREDAHYNNKLCAEAVTSAGKPDVIRQHEKNIYIQNIYPNHKH